MNESTSVLSALEAQLGPEMIQTISSQLGTDSAATRNAVSMAVPLLLGGLAKNAGNAEGAAALDNALNAHDGGILDNLSSLFAGGGAGAAILAHILGSRRTPIEQGVGRATGMNGQQVAQLLMMLAPLVMGVLGRLKRQQSLGPERLPDVLGQANLEMARQSPAAGGLSRILDTNHDGHIADDVARLGSSVLGGLLGQGASS